MLVTVLSVFYSVHIQYGVQSVYLTLIQEPIQPFVPLVFHHVVVVCVQLHKVAEIHRQPNSVETELLDVDKVNLLYIVVLVNIHKLVGFFLAETLGKNI